MVRTRRSPHRPLRHRAPLLGALLAAALLAGLAEPGSAQGQVPLPGAGGRAPRPELPELPPLRPDSPRDSWLYADRIEVRPDPASMPAAVPVSPTSLEVTLGTDVTGTAWSEPIAYVVPSAYDPSADPVPLVVAYHGFGSSASSVAKQTTLDEECEARGWFYLSVTGLDDKVFGSELCQRHVASAIGWMTDRFAIDRDRVYLVGFSMGGGVSLSFASRHRDPDGPMIAAVGSVAGAFDWTLTWNLAPALRPWLEHPVNFGGPPATHAFLYRRASGLFADPATYPPLPGTTLDLWSMATNLRDVPVYLAWDVDDSLGFGTDQQLPMATLLSASGGDVTTRTVSGTVDHWLGLPAPHSWAVLDEADLFAFFEDKRAVRHPDVFAAQVDRPTSVSWAEVTPRDADSFAWLDGAADALTGRLTLGDVSGAEQVTVSPEQALGPGAWPARVTATSADGTGFTLSVVGDGRAPSYFLDAVTGELVTGTESDPARNALSLRVEAGAHADVVAVSVPWSVRLWTEPDPVAPGADLRLILDAPTGPGGAWLVASLSEALTPLAPGVTLVAYPLPPALIVPLALDPSGDAILDATLPANPGLSGVRLVLQAVTRAPGGLLGEVSNAFALDIE